MSGHFSDMNTVVTNNDIKLGILVVNLPYSWHCKASTWTGCLLSYPVSRQDCKCYLQPLSQHDSVLTCLSWSVPEEYFACCLDARQQATTTSHRSYVSSQQDCSLSLTASLASRVEDPGFKAHLRRDISGVKSYQSLKNWHSSGYPSRRLVLYGQCWDWLARCQYTVTGWDGKFGLQLLSQCGST